jgi:hypothetical protein
MLVEYSVIWQKLLSVNHKILLTKLHFFGIQGETASWFRAYLTDRKQNHQI